jgi:hypothetical protein
MRTGGLDSMAMTLEVFPGLPASHAFIPDAPSFRFVSSYPLTVDELPSMIHDFTVFILNRRGTELR